MCKYIFFYNSKIYPNGVLFIMTRVAQCRKILYYDVSVFAKNVILSCRHDNNFSYLREWGEVWGGGGGGGL